MKAAPQHQHSRQQLVVCIYLRTKHAPPRPPCPHHHHLPPPPPPQRQLWEKFKPGEAPPPALGASRDYNVDMVPKFMMANGKLVKALIYTDVTKYLEFKAVDGSYVLNKGRVYKTPVTPNEALASPLMGMFEKFRARGFFV